MYTTAASRSKQFRVQSAVSEILCEVVLSSQGAMSYRNSPPEALHSLNHCRPR